MLCLMGLAIMMTMIMSITLTITMAVALAMDGQSAPDPGYREGSRQHVVRDSGRGCGV
jgi:hypothetical protein